MLKKFCIFYTLFACAAIFGGCRLLPSQYAGQPVLSVYFINVGQGLSVLVADGQNHELLYDAGPASSDTTIIRLLDSLGIDTIETFVLSHPDADHYGAMFSVFRHAAVQRVLWRNIEPYKSENCHISFFLRDTMHIPEIPVYAGDTIRGMAGCRITCLWPGLIPYWPADTTNNNSIVLKLDCGETSCLLPGDIYAPAESTLTIQYGDMLSSNLLCTSHHGSKYANSMEWLATISPAYAVCSCGSNNVYGHPADDALRRLAAAGCACFRTDRQGTIRFISNGWEWRQ